jgi:hypothetical protein
MMIVIMMVVMMVSFWHSEKEQLPIRHSKEDFLERRLLR